MQKRKSLFMLCMIIGLISLLAGCTGIQKTPEAKGSLKITLSMLGQGKTESSLQTVSDKIELSEFIVTVSKNSTTLTQKVAYTGSNTAEVTFTNLVTGEWKIDVIAKDGAGHSCYGGSATSSVTTNVTTVEIPLYLLNGNLDTKVILPSVAGLNITSGKVTLANPVTGVHIEKDLAIQSAEGFVDYGSVKAGTWYVEAELFENDKKLVWGSGVITVLPDQNNTAIIEFGDLFQGGDLKIIVVVNESPSDPTGLSATIQNSSVVLEWNTNPEPNIAGYTVYRATSETGFKKLLTYSLISGTSYTDTDVQTGEHYYYWVQAYDSKGYSSELSAPCAITVTSTPTEVTIDLSKYSRVFYVNQITGNDSPQTDGSISTPFKTIKRAASSGSSVDNSVIYIVSPGTYPIVDGLTDILSRVRRLTFIVDPKLFGKVIFDLQNTEYYQTVTTQYPNTFIGIVFRRSDSGSNQYYENIQSGSVKLSFYNCVFDKGVITPNETAIRGVNQQYYNCTFIPTFSAKDDIGAGYLGDYTNCAFAQSSFTNDSYNLHGATFDATYRITSTDWQNAGTGFNPDGTQANLGVYGGTYAWGLW